MKVLVSGIGGRMGGEIARLAREGFRGASLVAGYDVTPLSLSDCPTYTDWNAVRECPDLIIDFSHHAGTKALLSFAVARNIPVLIATTAHTDEELEAIREAGEVIPVFHAANMSLGVALLAELAKAAVRLYPHADVEIVEKHHNRKLDAPSGTALHLANAIREVREDATLNCGRSGNAKRTPSEIGIHAIRMGNIVGEHEILIGTDTETITLRHEAHSRALFAEGALAAAAFLVGRDAGLYGMADIIRL